MDCSTKDETEYQVTVTENVTEINDTQADHAISHAMGIEVAAEATSLADVLVSETDKTWEVRHLWLLGV